MTDEFPELPPLPEGIYSYGLSPDQEFQVINLLSGNDPQENEYCLGYFVGHIHDTDDDPTTPVIYVGLDMATIDSSDQIHKRSIIFLPEAIPQLIKWLVEEMNGCKGHE